MLLQPFSRSEREGILQQQNQVRLLYGEAKERGDSGRARELRHDLAHLETEYFERVPVLCLSCCPYDGQPLMRTFDPYALDGLWWRASATPEEPPPCRHFCVLVGAVNYNGQQPRAGDYEVRPGPEVPYVIPRLLQYHGMVAVLSEIAMHCGYTAYPIAYFAERRPPPEELTAGWARSIHSYTTQLGEHGWDVPNDVWDFDLMPWVEARKVRWCVPGTASAELSNDPPQNCPYVDLPGQRERMVVQRDRAWPIGLPGGEPIWPLDQ